MAANFKIDVPSVLGDMDDKFLSADERDNVNKGAAHLTEKLTLDADSDVDLQAIVKRSVPVFSRLIAALRKIDDRKEATYWLDRSQALLERAKNVDFGRGAANSDGEAGAPPMAASR